MPYIFPRLQQIISRGDDLPTLPTIVLQLHRVLDDPHAGVSRVAHLIEQDPALTTRLLRLSNSGVFGRAGAPISTVSGAIARMGLNQVRAVCTVLAVVKAFGNHVRDSTMRSSGRTRVMGRRARAPALGRGG